MPLSCSKCSSNELIEKECDSIHKKAVYCLDCNAWVKWGGIESNVIPDGEYLAEVISGEIKNDMFILFLLKTQDGHKVKHFIWKLKDKNKYNFVAYKYPLQSARNK
jgi:hypothetical protein